MNRDRWTRVAQLYDSALDHPPPERGSFLARACGGDADLQREVESLFAQDDHIGPLDRPALDGAAELLGGAATLAPGTRLGPYRLDDLIGSGGMGDVYRATDTRLDRIVAVKILPGDLSTDPRFRERFDREAKAIAALSHPHICALYDVGSDQGVDFLVLEHLEGQTLAARLEKGPLPIDEALRHAADIADALAVAHGAGIVHRDLKPANIFMTKSGAKLLDFGLARASGVTMAPGQLTAQGMIVGTLQYMAPEQLKGQSVDTRTDIYAFGMVLSEMLPSTAATPPFLDRLVRRCVAKNPDDRWQSAVDLADELRWVASGRTRPSRTPLVMSAVSLVVGAVLAGVAFWMIAGPRAEQARQPTRFEIIPPAAQPLSVGPLRSIAISPDGTHLVYRAGSGNQSQLVVRPMNELAGRPLANTTGANHPFFSPDGRWIGFNFGGRLQKIAVTGGSPIALCAVGSPERGAAWVSDDTIVFGSADRATGLFSVPAAGGLPTALTTPDAGSGELDHVFPSALPNGGGVLFTIVTAERDSNQVAVLDLKTGRRKVLIRGGDHAVYVESGHLLYAVGGAIRAVRFDPVRLDVLSDSVPVIERVATTGSDVPQFSVSRGGTLVYVPVDAEAQRAPSRSLVWVDRQGREQPIAAAPHAYTAARVSPDNTRIALETREGREAVWIWDLRRETLTRLSSDASSEMLPVWMPDGQRIIFNSARGGSPNLFWRRADGSGAVEPLNATARPQFPYSVSPDGARVFIAQLSPDTQGDVGVFDLKTRQTEILLQTPFQEYSAEISPDGRWLAYQSNESGRYEIYVRPFPKVDEERISISSGGGIRAAWAKNGRELFYFDSSNRLTAVTVRPHGSTLDVGKPAAIVEAKYFAGEPTYGRPYDVSADGRFLMIKDDPSARERSTSASMVVVENWFEELKRLVPAR